MVPPPWDLLYGKSHCTPFIRARHFYGAQRDKKPVLGQAAGPASEAPARRLGANAGIDPGSTPDGADKLWFTWRDELAPWQERRWGFAYEWHDAHDAHNAQDSWLRSYGNENWEVDEQGLMRLRYASINDLPIAEHERKFRWPAGRRPDEHPGLSDLGL